jgi:hypothetical protein
MWSRTWHNLPPETFQNFKRLYRIMCGREHDIICHPRSSWVFSYLWYLIYKVTCCVRLSDATFRGRIGLCLGPLDTEKSDGGCREKWREKDKKTVGWRAFGVLYLCVGRGPETQCPFIEVLKPRSWEPNAAMRACRHGRIVSDRHGYPLVYIYVKWSFIHDKGRFLIHEQNILCG